ncbi:MAG TPA: hypothetical protein VIH89_14175 [Candidatus Sulfotelmatobacter sp.]
MNKRLAIIAILVTLTPAAVACQQQVSTYERQREAQQATQPSSAITKDSSTHYQQPRDDKPQGWHKFVTWPEGVTTWAILFTLGAIAWQAIETRRAAQATARYAEAFIESQRPTLATYPKGNPFADLMDKDTPSVQLSLMNRGQTTAYECIYESWIEMLPVPPPVMDFTSNADHASVAERFSLPPNHDPMVINIPFTKGLSDADRRDLGEARKTAYIRLRVTFRDAFTPSRYADFGFWVMYKGLGILPKYHDSN